jgi:hypothetical protein
VWASRDERSTCSIWTAWALLEERAGQVPLARAYFREALKRDRFAVDVRILWAGMEARADNVPQSRQLFEGALGLDQTNAAVWTAYEEMEVAKGFKGNAGRVFARSQTALAEAGSSTATTVAVTGLTADWPLTSGGGSNGPPLPSGLVTAAAAAQDWVRQAQLQRGTPSARRTDVEQAYGQLE